ncbi:MAG: DJ-1/PfpI family protein [Candidatus Hydrogenedentes bacterium]|nr:DJ-1/PfpI family protein [Candidatus Hydrogenedentota bacterium]
MTQESPRKRRAGVLLFERFETLDACGPMEMFGTLPGDFELLTVARESGPVASVHGVRVYADYGFADCPPLDILLVPGGIGSRKELKDPAVLDWLRAQYAAVELMTSVCTGALLLAAAGILDGKRATSNKRVFDEALALSGKVMWIRHARWVEDGNLVTSSGVSAGMDMALAVIERLLGSEKAEFVAQNAEYLWNRDPDNDPFA